MNIEFESRVFSSLTKIFPDNIDCEAEPQKSALIGEPLSFQVAYRGDCNGSGYCHIITQFESDIDLKYIACYKTALVPVINSKPKQFDDYYDKNLSHLYPDVLLKRQAESKFSPDGFWSTHYFEEGENNLLNAVPKAWQSIFITINEEGLDIPKGKHFVKIKFISPYDLALLKEEKFEFEIIDEKLHPQTISNTSWFHADCLSSIYGVEPLSDRHFEIMQSFMKEAGKTGMNMILLPAFTPPLDTPIGRERTTIQLVQVEVKNGEYHFDFTLMDRYIKLAQESGINRFEHSHLFTQWGASHAPKIMATVNGEYKRIFGWETDSLSKEYGEFLRAYLKAFKEHILALNVEDVLMHVSDEPQAEHFEYYKNAHEIISEELKGFHLGDALSHYKFYEEGYVETPIVATDSKELDKFIENCDNLWVYYTGDQANNNLPNRLVYTTSARNRILGIKMYCVNAKGFLNWGYNYYYEEMSHGLVNPYNDTGIFTKTPGSSYIVYPSIDGKAIPSIRMKIFYEGINDYRALQNLEDKIGRGKVLEFIKENLGEVKMTSYIDEKQIISFREKLNEKLK